MRRSFTLLCVLFALSLPVVGQKTRTTQNPITRSAGESDYFPLQTGNQWIFRATDGSDRVRIVTVGEERVFADRTYVQLTGFRNGDGRLEAQLVNLLPARPPFRLGVEITDRLRAGIGEAQVARIIQADAERFAKRLIADAVARDPVGKTPEAGNLCAKTCGPRYAFNKRNAGWFGW